MAEGKLFQFEMLETTDALELLRSIAKSQDEMAGRMAESERRLAALAAAFPDDDPLAHRRAHEAMIEEHNANTAFWRDLRFTLAKGGFMTAVVLLLALLFAGLIATVSNSRAFMAALQFLKG